MTGGAQAAKRPTLTTPQIKPRMIQDAERAVRGFGGFFAMMLDVFVLMPRRPFAWRELITQIWFVARVGLLPSFMLAIPFCALVVFQLNVLLGEIGAGDLGGTGAALATVTDIGPTVAVLVVGGAGATAMCADMGARTIREELDALRVMGVNPIQALVVPRVIAGTIDALLLTGFLIIVGLAASYVFSVYVQHFTPGPWVSSLTLITHLPQLVSGLVKGALFGLAASLIGCYLGTAVSKGPQGVGNAVNETVVYSLIALFIINLVVTAVTIKVSPS